MKRSPMPPRRTPMRRTEFRTRRRAADIPTLIRMEVFRRSDGLCEILHPDCTGRAVHMHHRLLRSQGGRHEALNLLHLCHAGHAFVHSNPTLSYEQGWMIRSGS